MVSLPSTKGHTVTDSPSSSTEQTTQRSITPMVLIVLITFAPVVFALLAYYVHALERTPEEHNNYDTLIIPQRTLPAAETLSMNTLEGEAVDLNEVNGLLLLVTEADVQCLASCVR